MKARNRLRGAAKLVGIAVLAAPMMLLAGAPAQAQAIADDAAAACANRTQIGTTGYIKVGGETFASVKQFKGCGKNWAYGYVWESYRNRHSKWNICVSIAAKASDGVYDLWDLTCARNDHTVELWSSGAPTLSKCSYALGEGPGRATARTDIQC